MVVKWTFYDPVFLVTTAFEINPSDGGSPALQRNLTTQSTVAPGGKTILFEGNETVQTLDFSGTILTQTQYDMLITMFGRRHQLQLTDDLGRVFTIFITKFEPKRVRASHTPYKHTYNVSAIITDWP